VRVVGGEHTECVQGAGSHRDVGIDDHHGVHTGDQQNPGGRVVARRISDVGRRPGETEADPHTFGPVLEPAQCLELIIGLTVVQAGDVQVGRTATSCETFQQRADHGRREVVDNAHANERRVRTASVIAAPGRASGLRAGRALRGE